MSTNLHTAIAHGAAATHDTINAPLAQLDAKINPTVAEYEDTSSAAQTVTTGGTFYAVTSFEVSFTPAYTGQVFTLHLIIGTAFSAAGVIEVNMRVTDSGGTTVRDDLIRARASVGSSSDRVHFSGSRAWTAGAGDVGATRKAKVYMTHDVNGTSVTLGRKIVQAVSH